MLGLLHRTALEQGRLQFAEWLVAAAQNTPAYYTRRQERLHTKPLYDWLAVRDTELLRRIVLGQVRMHNGLPQEAVDLQTVGDFQTWLQNKVKEAASEGRDNWENLHNLRKRSWKQERA